MSDIGIRIRRTGYSHPGMRWRWDIVGAGMSGYTMTKRAATREANRQLYDVLRLIGG